MIKKDNEINDLINSMKLINKRNKTLWKKKDRTIEKMNHKMKVIKKRANVARKS